MEVKATGGRGHPAEVKVAGRPIGGSATVGMAAVGKRAHSVV